ncbi:hypothetical protein EW146_g6332 [Bondarzewia mesenterica]|uniref:RING-type domain-containing protein n=1 Tax=Bondarzewia mesenterica TaxID=1095465 RepID=A0A4S4LUJ2_9AGAM|nr:hypothetical protein EW146_g6332 [Bondarzewia mesenterica]
MSTISAHQYDVDIWEFVTCARCRLPFSPDPSAPPPIPFWLTECGHVICNNHLNSDQSCAQCAAQQIQIVPLSRKMEPPMSEWFCSLPSALDAVAHSTKFQLETMASFARYYKAKYLQQRSSIERIKAEIAEVKALRHTIEELRSENEQLRQYAGLAVTGPASESSKRRRTDAYRSSADARDFSSPRSVPTPLGPNRLTLPPNHQQPIFSQQRLNPEENSGMGHGVAQQRDRPGSSRFVQQYAYVPPQTPQNQGLSTMQPEAGPSHELQVRNNSSMPPPPTPVNRGSNGGPSRMQVPLIANQPSSASRNRAQMLPPTNNFISAQPPSSRFGLPPGSKSSAAHSIPSANSNRFILPSSSGGSLQHSGFVPQTPSGGSRRFVPPTPAGSRAPSRASGTSNGAGSRHNQNQNQRMSFVPGT